MNNVLKLCNYYFDSYEETYDEGALNEKEGQNPKQFKMVHSVLAEWLESKNDFNEAKRLIDDISIDMNKNKVGNKDKKVFNDCNRLITGVSNNKAEKEDGVQRLKKSMPDWYQLRQKQKTVFQNKMIQVVYQVFNLFGLNKEFLPLLNEK